MPLSLSWLLCGSRLFCSLCCVCHLPELVVSQIASASVHPALPGQCAEHSRQTATSHGDRAARCRWPNSPLTSFVFPGHAVIFINHLPTIRKMFITEADNFSERPLSFRSLVTHHKPFGIINASNPAWIHCRRAGLHILRDLGFGKSVLEDSLEEECHFLQDYLQSQVGNTQGFSVKDTMSKCSSDIMSSMLFGRKFALEGHRDVEYVQLIDELLAIDVRLLTMFPVLRFFENVPIINRLVMQVDIRDKILAYLQQQIEEHRARATHSEHAHPVDFIDHFLVLQKKEKDPLVVQSYSDDNLQATLFDLFVAGTDTTSVTLTWAIALLCHCPEIQEKVHQELVGVFGNAKHPNMSQLNQCPYTRAVMSEVLRFGVTAPTSLPHTATQDVYSDEHKYWIPKDSLMMANIYYVQRDPAVWKYPNQFYPEHFYNAASNAYVGNEHLISFSMGRRVCLGESLARQEFFLFLSAMLLQFRFEFHESSAAQVEHILMGCDNGLIRSPNKYLVKVFSRSSDEV